MAAPEVRRLRLWQDRIETEVEIGGSGPPLVYLHGPWGLAPDRAFVARLADGNTVYAPEHSRAPVAVIPRRCTRSTTGSTSIVYHGELFDRLELAAPALVGHSFGALVAAEFAAAAPKSVGRLVLIDPVGLWRDDLPVKNWMILSDKARRRALFADPEGEAARRFFDVPSDPAERVDTLAQFIWAQACTGKFVWPIADRGFKKPHSPHCGADADRLGQGGRHHCAGLCAGVCQADFRRAGRAHRQGRTPAASRTVGDRRLRRCATFWRLSGASPERGRVAY